jgi:hypothetical protein
VAIAEDASAPAATGGTTTAATTASFTPAANSLLVAIAVVGNSSGASARTGTLSDSLTSTWTLKASLSVTAIPWVGVWMMDAGASPAARTVTITGTGGTNAKGTSIAVKVLTGAAALASQTGNASASSGAGTTPSIAITPTTTGSYLVHGLGYNGTSVTLTVNASSTSLRIAADATNAEAYGIVKGTAAGTASSAVTLGFSNTGLVAQMGQLAYEVLPAAAAAAWVAPQIIHPAAVRRASFY